MLPDHVRNLVVRVLAGDHAVSTRARRQEVFDHVAALTRGGSPQALAPDLEPYIRKVALNADKVLDREIDAMRAAGRSVDEVFELTVAAAVSAGVTRLEMALAALDEVADAPAD